MVRNCGTRTSSTSLTTQAQAHVDILEALDHLVMESVGEIHNV
jgi:hypothetical protein